MDSNFAFGAYKKYALLTGLSMALALSATLASAAVFTPGSIVVYRVGDGSSTAVSSTAALPVYLDEYSPTGTLLQSVAMPTTAGTAPLTYPLTASNTASEGMLKRSVNGQCLTVPGYAAVTGTTGLAATASTSVQREVAFVSASAGVNTTTRLGTTAISASNIRGAVSNDCTEAWVSGNGSAAANKGIWYAASIGASTSTQIETSPVTSQGIDITTLSGGSQQLYASASGFSKIGSGLPTAAGSVTAQSPFPTADNYRGLTFLQLNSSSTGTDTVYVADNSASTVAKYTYNGTAWTAKGSFTTTTVLLPPGNAVNSGFNVTGLNAVNLGDGEVAVYFTDAKNGYIYRVIDTSGYGGTLSSSPAISLFATATGAPTYAVYYGLAPAPESALPSSAPNAATNANATSITSTSFTANWTAPASGAAVAFYVVDVSADNFATAPSQTIIVASTQTSANISGLTNSTNYFRVRAVNSAGASSDLTSTGVAVASIPQTITFGTGPSIVVGGTGTVSATGGASGNPVTFTSTTTGICTVSGTNGSTVTGIATGTCTITADQAGNASYSAAPEATQNIIITASPIAQTISFGAAPTLVYGGIATLSATGGGSGNPVIFTSATTSVCNVSGSTVTVAAAGTCTINANQAGNSNYYSATQAAQTFTIGTAPQVITFGSLPVVADGTATAVVKLGSTATVSATGGASGNPVTYTNTTPGVCSISGNLVTGLATGTCIIAADQASTANYNAATEVSQSFTFANAITAFTADNIVISTVFNVNNGGADLDTASPIVLQEFQLGAGSTSATLTGALTLPQASSGSNSVISGEYGSASEGILQQSVNGMYLTVMGYGVNATAFNTAPVTTYGNAALGQSVSLASVDQTGTLVTTVPRVVALIGTNASVDTSSAMTGVFNQNNPRSVATIDGTSFYLSGQASGKTDPTQGVFYATLGATTATAIDNSTDTRVVSIINSSSANTLYVSRDVNPPSGGVQNFTNVSTLTNASGGLPTSATGLVTTHISPPASALSSKGNNGSINLTAGLDNGVNNARIGSFVYLSPEQYFMASPTVMYVADSGQPKNGSAGAAALGEGGLQKWVLTSGTWTLDYVLVNGLNLVDNANANAATPTAPGVTGLLGLTGKVVGDQVRLFATSYGLNELSQSYLYEITDSLSATLISQVSSEQFTVLYTDATGQTSIRGVSFAPAIPQVITFGTAPVVTVGGTGTVTATGGASGNPVVFTSTTTGVCTIGTDGITVTGVSLGTCTIDADQAGTSSYSVATTVAQSFAISTIGGVQAISFDFVPTVVVGGTATITATGGASGNPVTFTSTTSSVCTVSGSIVSGVAAGTCTIAANQTGNSSYIAATEVTQSFSINMASQAITFGSAPSVSVGATSTVSATGGNSGNPVTFSSQSPTVCSVVGSTVTGVTVGTCSITADQAGNASYAAASTATQSFSVTAATTTGDTGGDVPLPPWSLLLLAAGLMGAVWRQQRAA